MNGVIDNVASWLSIDFIVQYNNMFTDNVDHVTIQHFMSAIFSNINACIYPYKAFTIKLATIFSNSS